MIRHNRRIESLPTQANKCPLYPLSPGAGRIGKGKVLGYKHGGIGRETVDFVP
jgi:hypothetical protein